MFLSSIYTETRDKLMCVAMAMAVIKGCIYADICSANLHVAGPHFLELWPRLQEWAVLEGLYLSIQDSSRIRMAWRSNNGYCKTNRALSQ